MEFFETEEGVVSYWDPKPYMQGYLNILHGGIQALLMDEVAGWLVNVKLKTAGVTAQMTTKYHKPVYVNKGIITIKGKLNKTDKKLAFIDCEILNNENVVCSSGEVVYWAYPENVAREKLWFPGYESFFE